jgi:hypothetical protein
MGQNYNGTSDEPASDVTDEPLLRSRIPTGMPKPNAQSKKPIRESRLKLLIHKKILVAGALSKNVL